MPSNTPPKTIAVFGANGRVGSIVVARALKRGYRVIAFVYGESRLPHNPSLTVFRGDVRNATDVRRTLRDADVVVSALGSWGTATKDILASGMSTIVPVMEELQLVRIVSLTGADAVASDDRPGILNKLSRFMIGMIGGKVIRDGEAHIKVLQASTLDWTIVRSPVMLGGGLRPYRLVDQLAAPYATIRRASVAEAMIDLAVSEDHPKSLVTIVQAKT